MAAKEEDIGGVAQRAAGLVAANKLEIVEGYPGKEKKKEDKKKKGAVNQIQPPTDDGVVKDPKLYAKARAKQSMFSGSGRVITPGKDGNDRFQGRYQMGRFAGKTPEEADEIYERTWEKATPAQREVYAKKADPGAGMAPSERAKQLKLQRDKEAKENPVPQANAREAEKPAEKKAEKKAEEVPEEKSTTFNENGGDSMGFDSMGKIHAIGSGETENGSYVGATPEQQAAARAEADKKSESEQARAKEIEAERVSKLPMDERMRAQGKTREGGNPITKAPLGPGVNSRSHNAAARLATPPKDDSTPISRLWDASKAIVSTGILKTENAVRSPFRTDMENAEAKNGVDGAWNHSTKTAGEASVRRNAEVQGIRPTAPVVNSATEKPIASGDLPAPTSPEAPAVTEKPAAPAAAKTKYEYDYEPGEGKELTGMVNDRKTYSKVDSLYGGAKTTVSIEKPAAPGVAPVMKSQTQNIDQQRTDYQARNQNVAGADRSLPESLRTPTTGIQKPLMPRGAASQEADPMSYKRNDPTVNQDQLRQHGEALKGAQNFGGSDADFNARRAEPDRLYGQANEITRIAMGGQTAQLAQGLDRMKPPATQPVSQRVVAKRPATPEELKRGRI